MDHIISTIKFTQDPKLILTKSEMGGEEYPGTMETASDDSVEIADVILKNRLTPEEERELENDVNNVANYIDVKKVVGKNESNYYYTPKNRSTREKIDKIGIKKVKTGRSKEVDNLDTSQHARKTLLDGCKGRSWYFGPLPTRKDGSPIEGVLKDRAYFLRRSSQQSNKSDASTRSVELKSIHIREHERIAGDNPCVTSGVPLSIGWGYVQHDPIPLDVYENAKGPPRDKIEMMVPAGIRRSMLRDEFRVSVAELNASMKIVHLTKRNRKNTIASEHLEGWQEVAQSAKRKFKRIMNKTSTKKEEAALWEQAHRAATEAFLKEFGSDALGENPELVGVGEVGVGPFGSQEMPKEISIRAEE